MLTSFSRANILVVNPLYSKVLPYLVSLLYTGHSKQGSKDQDNDKYEILQSSQLKASDLKDGLRILMLQDGKFWPSRLNSTKLPDVYGVVLDRQRGNRPIILPRDDILKEAVSSSSVYYGFIIPLVVLILWY